MAAAHAAEAAATAYQAVGETAEIVELPTGDIWLRDTGPIVTGQGNSRRAQLFRFNGWGGKYLMPGDTETAAAIAGHEGLDPAQHDLILEGGAIDTDGHGHLLTTRACLRNTNRNPALDEATLESRLRESLGVDTIWWLDHGHLEGDDTDAHVDTLARFVNATTLAYVHCDDPDDSHYPALSAMAAQLRELADREGLDLVPLPMARAQYSDDGERLPATYANFLITNCKILVPLYDCDTDDAALKAFAAVAGERQVQGIPCRPLIEQGGSLHCITMQLPEGVLA